MGVELDVRHEHMFAYPKPFRRCRYGNPSIGMTWRDERGQTSAEYMGVLLVVAVIVGALLFSGLPGAIARYAGDQVCAIFGDCAAPAAGKDGEADGPRAQRADPDRGAAQRELEKDAERGAPAAGREPDGLTAAEREHRRKVFHERMLLPPDPSLSPEERDALARKRVFDDYMRSRGQPVPTVFDPDGDGVQDFAPAPERNVGGAADRFGGEACGLGKALLFGSEATCGLGDEDSEGYQQGERLAGIGGTLLSPGKVTKVTKLPKLLQGGKAVKRPPSTHGRLRPDPPEPRLRTGNRRTRAERNSPHQPERPAVRPSPDRRVVIGRGKDIENHPNRIDLPPYGLGPRGVLDPRATWKQNAGQLREAMRSRRPIQDLARSGDNRGPYLNAERALLEERGWTRRGGYWYPPPR